MVEDGDEGWGSGFLIGVEDMGRGGGGGAPPNLGGGGGALQNLMEGT